MGVGVGVGAKQGTRSMETVVAWAEACWGHVWCRPGELLTQQGEAGILCSPWKGPGCGEEHLQGRPMCGDAGTKEVAKKKSK